MSGREVTEAEHRALLRKTLTNAAEITEAFRAVYEDGIEIDPRTARQMLVELRNCIDSVYVDLEPVSETVKFKNESSLSYVRVFTPTVEN